MKLKLFILLACGMIAAGMLVAQTPTQTPTGVARTPALWPELIRRTEGIEATAIPILIDWRFPANHPDNEAHLYGVDAVAEILSIGYFGDIATFEDTLHFDICEEGELELVQTWVAVPPGTRLFFDDGGGDLGDEILSGDLVDIVGLDSEAVWMVNPHHPNRRITVLLDVSCLDEGESEDVYPEGEGEEQI